MKKAILTLIFVSMASVSFGQEIPFDEKTKSNIIKISTEIQELQLKANLIIQTVANMNGIEKFTVKEDLTGIIVPEENEEVKE